MNTMWETFYLSLETFYLSSEASKKLLLSSHPVVWKGNIPEVSVWNSEFSRRATLCGGGWGGWGGGVSGCCSFRFYFSK